MISRKWSVVIVIFLIAMGYIISQVLSNQKEPMRRRPPARSRPLNVLTVTYGNIYTKTDISGLIEAFNKIDLYAEVSGLLLEEEKPFRPGVAFAKGEPLARMDDRVYKNTVFARRSDLLNQITLMLPDIQIDFPESAVNWEHYLQDLNINKPLKPLPEPASDKERYYIASRNIYTQYYSIKSMEETHAKYTIYAPFNGSVSQSNINPGTLVRSGQKLGEFVNSDLYEMEAAVSIRDVDRLAVGQTVQLNSEAISGTFTGRIMRISDVLDRSSMSVKVYIHLKDSRLKDGMYLSGHVATNPVANAFAVSKDLINEFSQCYAVEDSILVLKQVKIAGRQGDSIFIRGLPEGTKILGEFWADAREGAVLPHYMQNLIASPTHKNEDES